jgi:hypothetical protein
MKLSELHPVWREALACQEALRRLGFTSDDLFVSRCKDGRLLVHVESVHYGLTVNIPVGDSGALRSLSQEEFGRGWSQAAEARNGATVDELEHAWRDSLIVRQGVQLIVNLKMHGIELPATADA